MKALPFWQSSTWPASNQLLLGLVDKSVSSGELERDVDVRVFVYGSWGLFGGAVYLQIIEDLCLSLSWLANEAAESSRRADSTDNTRVCRTRPTSLRLDLSENCNSVH